MQLYVKIVVNEISCKEKVTASGTIEIEGKEIPWTAKVSSKIVNFGDLPYPKMRSDLRDAVLNTIGYANVPVVKTVILEKKRR